jgi:hypothetical protein
MRHNLVKNKFQFLKFFAFLFMLITFQGLLLQNSASEEIESKVIKTKSSDNIKAEIDKLQPDEYGTTLVVWDCDGVLVEKHRSYEVFDSQLPKIILSLQKNSIKTVVLTAAPISENSMRRLTYKLSHNRLRKLKRCGYSFEKSYPDIKKRELCIIVPKINSKFSQKYGRFDKKTCLYSNGVILCGKIPKSLCLEAFMKFVNMKPTKIIFIDDQKKNIYDIKRLCNRLKIRYVGIIFLGDPTPR